MRLSLLVPIPEFEVAAKLLDAAVEALMHSRKELARDLIVSADIPEINQYAISVVGKLSIEVHRQIKRPKCLPKEQRDATRMPSPSKEQAIFVRDNWHCRFCGVKVISKPARSILTKTFPDETRWIGGEFQRHYALYAMASSLDHVEPHGRGGKNEDSNFVTACYCCQFGRGEWTLEEMGLLDPRDRPPIVDSWDGLSRLTSFAT